MEAQEDFNNYFKLKRDQYLVEIRKGKNNRFLTAKRLKFAAASHLNDDDSENKSKDPPKNLTDPFEVQEYVNKLVSDLMQAIDGQDSTLILDAAERIRRTVSQSDNPPLEPLLKTNIAPTFVNFLCPENYHYDKLIFEFSWILANIASGDGFYVQYLADLGIIPRALNLLQHENIEIRGNAIYLLTNIAGESLEYRDQLLQGGIVDIIAYVYSTYIEGSSLTFLSELAWFLTVLSRGPQYPDFDQMTPILNIAHQLLLTNETKEVLSRVLRTFADFSDGGNQQIQKILDLGCVKKIVSLLNPITCSQVVNPALRTVGNLATGTNAQVEVLMKLNVIESIVPFLRHSAKATRKDAAWALSNIIAAGEEYVASVFEFEDGQILDRLFYMIDEEDFEVAKECTYCLTNACLVGNIDQIVELVERDFVELLVETIKENTETRLLKNCLDALEAILEEYKTQEELLEEVSCERILRRLAACGGYIIIEDLQKHQDDGIYKTVSNIIQNYFDYVEGEI